MRFRGFNAGGRINIFSVRVEGRANSVPIDVMLVMSCRGAIVEVDSVVEVLF